MTKRKEKTTDKKARLKKQICRTLLYAEASGDLTFDLTQKMTEVTVIIFDALSNAAYCVSLRGPGAELDQTPPSPPGAEVAEHQPGAG